MVEDSEIKTAISPFAIREGEIKSFDGKDGYVSINQIITKINLGHLSDVHFRILDLINEFEFLTSRQIFQLLTHRGIVIKSQDKLNSKLDQLVKSKILTRYYFTSEDSKGIFRVYCMEKMGKYLLTSKEIECKWQPTDNTKPVPLMKKRLAGNQTIIAYMRKSHNFNSYKVKTEITGKMSGKTIKGHGEVVLEKSGKSISLIFECVRREEDWEKKFIDRMKIYKDFLENFVQFDSGFERRPQLIFLCEDERHMVEVFKEILKNKMEIEKNKIYYTTDLKQNEKSLSKTLTEFKKNEETGKYIAENVDFKILE